MYMYHVKASSLESISIAGAGPVTSTSFGTGVYLVASDARISDLTVSASSTQDGIIYAGSFVVFLLTMLLFTWVCTSVRGNS